MPRKRSFINSNPGSNDDFESDIFKSFNSNESEKESEKSDEDDINFDGEEDDESDDNLLVNSDSEDANQDGDDIESRIPSKQGGDDSDDEEDDDDVPEAISFSSSKQSAMEQMKKAIKLIGDIKQNTKLKRKKLDEKYKEQKRKKLEDLSKNRLPEEFLADLSDVKESNKLSSGENHEKTKKSKKVKFKVKNLNSEDEDVGSLADTEEDFHETKEDFIPLESEDRLGGVEVVSLPEDINSNLPVSKDVINFKDQWLYGKSLRRESAKSRILKRKARLT